MPDERKSSFPERRLVLAVGSVAFAAGAWWSWESMRPGGTQTAVQAALDRVLAQPLPDPQGTMVTPGANPNKVRVLNFWATWCPPCVEEMPELSALAVEFRHSVEVFGIGIDSAANIRQFAEKHRISYPLLVAGASAIDSVRSLGNESGGLPFTVVVDRSTRVADRILGRVNIGRLRDQLLKLTSG